MNIERNLIELVNEIKGLPKQDINNIKMFVENREWGVALDSLCNQIYEFEVNITKKQFDKIKIICEEIKMDSSLWQMLKELIK